MDNPSSQQQYPSQGQQPTTTSTARNTRNLSIKEFFATRLMRTRSFESGGSNNNNNNNSPKDETSNWFDEFKARMTKKSQINSKQTSANSINSNNSILAEECCDDLIDPGSETVGVKFANPILNKHKHNKHNKQLQHQQNYLDDNNAPLVKDSCDNNYLENLSEIGEDDEILQQTNDISRNEFSIDQSSANDNDTSATTRSPVSGLSIRKRKLISCVESPDFDTASINTIFNRKDSRYEKISREYSYKRLFSKILNFITWCISYTVPFNYNLPWKLLSLINFTFVILIIALTSESKPDLTAFSFLNGFICGLIIATVCFIILMLSLIVKLLPKTSGQDDNAKKIVSSQVQKQFEESLFRQVAQEQVHNQSTSSNYNELSSTSLKKNIDTNDANSIDSSTKLKTVDDYSTFEVLENKTPLSGQGEQNSISGENNNNPLDEDDYKGWMIEYIGDYELRNKGEFKLKLIFVKIENRILYLCKPKNSHDAESTAFPVFVQQRIYNLETAVKLSANLLLPKNVRNRQKWVWSKKYPIRLEFQQNDSNSINNNLTSNNNIQPQNKNSSTTTEVGGSNSNSSIKTIKLTLFAKSCREKEEWFRRFKRIVEENRLAQNYKRFSFQSNLSNSNNTDNELGTTTSAGGVGGFSFGSIKSFRCRSPSPNSRSTVHTSKSSHLIHDPSKRNDNDKIAGKTSSNDNDYKSNLIRTKSCELLNVDQQSSTSSSTSMDQCDLEQQQNDMVKNIIDSVDADDSTLTKETAEVYSQALEYSNFIESQPKLSYKDYIEKVIESGQDATTTSDWFNALTGRIFFDVFSRDYWSTWFKRKIQRKLYRIRLPYFMETLTLSTIDLGTNAPQFLNVVSHSFDSFGLSIDFDMTYSGGLTMTFETKLNLLKIKNDNSTSSNNSNNSAANNTTNTTNQIATCSTNNVNLTFSSLSTTSAAGTTTAAGTTSTSSTVSTNNQQQQNSTFSSTSHHQQCENSNNENNNYASGSNFDSKSNNSESLNKQGSNKLHASILSSSGSTRTSGESSDSYESDSDSSSDSSCDEADVDEISDWEDYGAEKTRQSIVRFVDKIASSRYFQHATENRYIKKKLQDISNCPLVLIVKIESLSGILTLNVPPPQTDRIWYGFKPNPELTLKALPKMGDREVNLSHVTDWIEKKLAEEFRKILVIPNMEDIVLPVLKSDHLQYVTTTK